VKTAIPGPRKKESSRMIQMMKLSLTSHLALSVNLPGENGGVVVMECHRGQNIVMIVEYLLHHQVFPLLHPKIQQHLRVNQ
jgi:hypothetical protein